MTHLETGQSVGDLFDAMPASAVSAAEAVMDASMPQMATNLGALYSSWEKCDVAALAALQAESPLGSIPTMRYAFFTARNESWANTIASRGVSAKRHLLVVGALHLIGSGSLLDRLAARGLVVHRLTT